VVAGQLPDGQWRTAGGADELVGSFGAEEHWRYLGVVQNGDGEIEGMLEAVEAEVREEAAVLGRKRISLADMAYLSSTVILPGVLYKLKFSHANVKQTDRIQSSLLGVAAKKAELTAAAHKVLYGGYAWDAGGKNGRVK
jgi:hypothetical protein